ncbi:hypothetical protein [Janthinobacterium agaricidamnosum]|uniref:TonB C-terminal domain-containing protein n=1 Tax=Janthinobacterium agaricidamnosum NBRC 102515 = DSM 9628 TaxID=1349767 RepID=W0V4V5_9BURK|nr:hypothetical protein [Janthinobacterium agaricidamnosum]CDG82625.1 hypothetical protein GJA_1989 [Janthinobacterium agaricidamnosum NBRC 102515 = DSM 9628]
MRVILLLLASLFACASATAALADEAPLRYSLKQDEAWTGSNILRSRVRSSIPLQLPYHQLSGAAQQELRDSYKELAAEDEPPYPVRGQAAFFKALADANEILRVTGLLSLAVKVDQRGDVVDAAIYSTPSPDMGTFAAAVAIQQKFKPALCQGVPCTMDFLFEIDMK